MIDKEIKESPLTGVPGDPSRPLSPGAPRAPAGPTPPAGPGGPPGPCTIYHTDFANLHGHRNTYLYCYFINTPVLGKLLFQSLNVTNFPVEISL